MDEFQKKVWTYNELFKLKPLIKEKALDLRNVL
jgi:hypothetical protein